MACNLAPIAKAHRIGAPCYVRFAGACKSDWMIGKVVNAAPLTVEIIDNHPLWRGAEVTRKDALIRVDPKFWPKSPFRDKLALTK